MNISAIVPVWNGRDLLARLLDTLERRPVLVAELLIVDNGSTDGAPELARARGARVIAMGRNAGFAAAVNRGIREARQRWWRSSTATSSWRPTTWRNSPPLMRPSRPARSSVRSGLLDGTFDLTCRGATTWRCGAGYEDAPPFGVPRDIASPPWTAVLFRADVFRRVGLLEESFESYLEDADFGLRCALQHIVGRYVPDARAVHVGSAALGRWHPETVRRIARNQLLLAARHYSASATCGRSWSANCCGAAWRFGTARELAWVRGKCAGTSRFLRRPQAKSAKRSESTGASSTL